MSENDVSSTTPSRPPMPPANFDFLVMSLVTQAQMHLGLLHFGDESDRPEPDFEIAQHFIDLLGVLHDKTRGNLSLEEERNLQNSLTELRFRFIQARSTAQAAQ